MRTLAVSTLVLVARDRGRLRAEDVAVPVVTAPKFPGVHPAGGARGAGRQRRRPHVRSRLGVSPGRRFQKRRARARGRAESRRRRSIRPKRPPATSSWRRRTRRRRWRISIARSSANPTTLSALVGQGQALLALNRESDALAAFEAALAANPSLTDLRRRVEVLRFRTVERDLAARATGGAGRASRRGDPGVPGGDRQLARQPVPLSRARGRRAAEGRRRRARSSISARRSSSIRATPAHSRRSARCSRPAAMLAERWRPTTMRSRSSRTRPSKAKRDALVRQGRARPAARGVPRDRSGAADHPRRSGGADRRPARAAAADLPSATRRSSPTCGTLGGAVDHGGRARRRDGALREPHVSAAAPSCAASISRRRSARLLAQSRPSTGAAQSSGEVARA